MLQAAVSLGRDAEQAAIGFPMCPELTAEERCMEPEVCLNHQPLSHQLIKVLSAALRKDAQDTLETWDPQNNLSGGHGGNGNGRIIDTKPHIFQPAGALETTYSNLFILKMRKLGPREEKVTQPEGQLCSLLLPEHTPPCPLGLSVENLPQPLGMSCCSPERYANS